MKQPGPAFEPSADRDSVLREVEQVLALARSVSLGPAFDDIIRSAVESATDRLLLATRRRTARLAALAAVQQTVAGGFDLSAIMAGVYEHLREILDAPSLAVASYDAATDTLRCAFAVAGGAVVEPPSGNIPRGRCAAARVVRTGRPRIIHDRLKEPEGGLDLFAVPGREQPPRAVVMVPMQIGDNVIGVMQAGSTRAGAYGPEDVEFLATIANQTAMAMENARLYHDALQRGREVEALLAAAQELGADLEPSTVLRRVVEAAARLVDAELAGIGLAGAVSGSGDDPPAVAEDQKHGLLTRCTGAPLRFDRLWRDSAWQQLDCMVEAGPETFMCDAVPDRAGIHRCTVLPPLTSRMVVPVLGRDQRLLGVIALFNKRGAESFTPRDAEIAAAFASHAALALERANAYRAVEQSRNYLQALMDRTNAAILVLDPIRGQVRDVNAAAVRLLERERTALQQMRVFDLAPPEDCPAWETLLAGAPAGGSVQRELSMTAGDGASIPLDVTATRLDVDDAPAVVCLAHDQRPRLQREGEERLRALGEMASGVAHDFNNMLGVILGRTTLMLARAGQDADLRAHLDIVKQAALDGAETVKRLQAFSGVSRLAQHEAADVARVLRDAVEFTRPRWRDAAQQRGVTIRVAAEPGATGPAAGGAAELREVLVNMIFNAVDAMPEGGSITLRSWQEDGAVAVSVADTGTGMTEAVRARIFEPFFTTKGARGTGLGLSASYGIIARLGGHIAVESAPGQGTVFTISLPAAEEEAPAPAEDTPAAGPLRLLLVDDEPRMLRTARLMLEAEGHEVTAVPGGRAALRTLARGRFDAVLTDLGMPEMNGLQLTELLRARGHSCPVILITGWGMELDAERVRAVGVTGILPKPFDAGRLRSALAAIEPGRTADPGPEAFR